MGVLCLEEWTLDLNEASCTSRRIRIRTSKDETDDSMNGLTSSLGLLQGESAEMRIIAHYLSLKVNISVVV